MEQADKQQAAEVMSPKQPQLMNPQNKGKEELTESLEESFQSMPAEEDEEIITEQEFKEMMSRRGRPKRSTTSTASQRVRKPSEGHSDEPKPVRKARNPFEVLSREDSQEGMMMMEDKKMNEAAKDKGDFDKEKMNGAIDDEDDFDQEMKKKKAVDDEDD